MTKAIKLITETAALNKAIDSIATRGTRLDRDIGVAAMSVMAHHAEHGDVTLINRLIEAMPKGSRVNALREFINAHGAVKWNDETKAFDHDKTGNFDFEGAQEKPWTAYKAEGPYRPFDAAKAIENLLKRSMTADPKKGDRVTKEQAKAIAAFAAQMGVEVQV